MMSDLLEMETQKANIFYGGMQKYGGWTKGCGLMVMVLDSIFTHVLGISGSSSLSLLPGLGGREFTRMRAI